MKGPNRCLSVYAGGNSSIFSNALKMNSCSCICNLFYCNTLALYKIAPMGHRSGLLAAGREAEKGLERKPLA